MEGLSPEYDEIYLEVVPDLLLRSLKTAGSAKWVKIKLTKKHSPCLTLEIDLVKNVVLTSSCYWAITSIFKKKFSTEIFLQLIFKPTWLCTFLFVLLFCFYCWGGGRGECKICLIVEGWKLKMFDWVCGIAKLFMTSLVFSFFFLLFRLIIYTVTRNWTSSLLSPKTITQIVGVRSGQILCLAVRTLPAMAVF